VFGNVLSTAVNTLPADGGQIYVTFWSLVNGQWLYKEDGTPRVRKH